MIYSLRLESSHTTRIRSPRISEAWPAVQYDIVRSEQIWAGKQELHMQCPSTCTIPHILMVAMLPNQWTGVQLVHGHGNVGRHSETSGSKKLLTAPSVENETNRKGLGQ